MKARFFALAALVLGLASCQQEFNGAAPVGGEVDFQLSVGAGEISATRADIDGDTQEGYDSAYGAIDYLNEADWAEYDLRYSLEVYDVADDYTDAVPVKDRMVQIVDKYEPVVFDLRLVPNRDYHFVVFADFVLQGASSKANTDVQRELGLRHNIGENLGQITIKSDAINDEIADAYFATKDIRIENSAAKDIVLKRPYGKVRVVATDLDELNLNVTPGKVKVEYDKFHPLTFNAVTGEVAGEYESCTYEREYAEISKEKGGLQNHFYNIGYDKMTTTNANGVERHKYMTLFTDYILAEKEEQTAYHFTMTVWDQNEVVIKETHFNTDIPVARNMLTTVVGNVLTTATEINVSIDDNFATKYTLTMWDGKSVKPVVEKNDVYEIYEAAELAWFAQQVNEGNKFSGKTVKLCKDIHLNGEAWTPIGATGKFEGTFDGDKHVIEGLFVNMTDKTPAGLFANAKYVKNLWVCHAEVYGKYKSAVIVGDGLCSRIDNCHVENATVVVTPFNKDDANHVGGIVGYLSAENEAWVKDCSVKNAEIRGYRDVAAIAGTANQAAVVTDNKVKNVTVIADQTAEYKEVKVANVDAIAGRVHAKATVSGNTVGENVEVYVLVNTTANLEYQANNSPANRDIKIVLVGDVKGDDITIKQREGVNVIVAGAEGNTYNGSIIVNGDARANGEETLKFEGINFKSNAEKDFISAPTKIDNRYNYSHNITVDGCTFSSEAYNEKIVGIKLLTTYNAVVKNCTATNIHSLAQFQSVDNATVIENVKVVNCKNGISLGNMAKATIKNAEISAKVYGIRMDGAKERTVAATIENSTISAYIPVNVRKMNNDACNVEVEFLGDNNNLAGNTYEIAFCSNEYEQGVEPENPVGSFRLQNAEEFDAFYGTVTSFSAFDAAVNSNSDTVVAEGNISMPGTGVEVERDVVLDFAGFEYNAGSDASSRWYALEIYGEHEVVVKNADFTRAGIYAANGADVVFENGTINHKPERSSRYIFCSQSGATITIKDGTFLNDRQNNAYFWADASTIVVEGGNFGGVASKNKVVLTNNGQLIIKGGTFNFDPSAYVAPGSVVKKDGSNWVVSAIDESANIADVIADADAGATIALKAGNYTFPSSSVQAGQTIICEEGTVFTGNSKLNIKGATVVGATFSNPSGTAVDQTINGTFKNCTFTGSNALRWCYAGETCVFENCDFSGNTYGVHFDGGANDVTFKGCTFSGFNAFGAALTQLTLEDCTFVGNGKSGYNGANLWGSTIMKDCEFTFDGTTTYEWIDCCSADKAYSFENCTINGVAYTADNYADYLANIESRNEMTVKINGVDCAL